MTDRSEIYAPRDLVGRVAPSGAASSDRIERWSGTHQDVDPPGSAAKGGYHTLSRTELVRLSSTRSFTRTAPPPSGPRSANGSAASGLSKRVRLGTADHASHP